MSQTNIAASGAVKTGSVFYDENGTLTFTSTGQYSGGRYIFYLKKDQTAIDLTTYKNIEIEFGECDNGDGGKVDMVCKIVTNNLTNFFAATVANSAYVGVKNEKISVLANQTVAFGIKVKVNDYGKPADIEKMVTIKSIKLVSKDS